MKTRIIKSLLTLMFMFVALPMMSQDYLKIYFKDGHTERHFMHLVESIYTTKFDLEGNLHDDYQMQQIVMPDTTYSYYIADIDSMSFTKVDEEQVLNNVTAVANAIEPIFNQCESIEDMEQHLDEISNIDGVENVYSTGTDIVVQVKDWYNIVYNFFLRQEEPLVTNAKELASKLEKKEFAVNSANTTKPKVAIAFQQVDDLSQEWGLNLMIDLKENFKRKGFDVKIIADEEKGDEKLDADFYLTRMFDYDMLLLYTHGLSYGGKHALYTGEGTNSFMGAIGIVNIGLDWVDNKLFGIDIDDVGIAGCNVGTERLSDGTYKEEVKYYWYVSEDLIKKSSAKFNGQGTHIVFIGACEQLKGKEKSITFDDGQTETYGDSFAQILFNKGADYVAGYTKKALRSCRASNNFYRNLLNGFSLEASLAYLPGIQKKEITVVSNEKAKDARLIGLYNPNANEEELKKFFLFKTKTEQISAQELAESYKSGNVVVSGTATAEYPITTEGCPMESSQLVTDNEKKKGYEGTPKKLRCGFRHGLDSNLSKDYQEVYCENPNIEEKTTDNVHFSCNIALPPEYGTYYYQAFTYDGVNYNFGKICSFPIDGGNTPDDRMKVGDSFTVPTKEGTEVVYTITKKDATGNTCKVGFNAIAASSGVKRLAGSKISPAIDLETVGTITIPELAAGYKVTALGKNAFKGCKKLTAVNLPESILEIGQSAAEGCSGLTSISIPKNVKTIKANAYGGCGNVTGVYCEISDPFAIDINVFLTEDEESRGVTNSSIFTKAMLYVPVGSKGKYASMEGWNKFKYIEENTDEENNAPEGVVAIDLGLPSGTMWASCNVGATKPEEYGGYYAWGETSEKFNYDWSTYVHADGYWESIHDIGSDISGTEYDVAHVKWGGDWCMPTHDEQRELVNNCTSEWTTLNGVNGWKFTSRINGNSIFLPNAGFRRGRDSYDGGGYYRSSSCSCYRSGTIIQYDRFYVWSLYFNSSDVRWSPIKTQEEGYSVRPVIHSTPTLVDLTLSITDPMTVLVYDKVTVQITTGNGSYTAESDNKNVAIAGVDDYASVIIKGVSAGTATITVTDTKSGQTAIITIVVNDRFVDPDNLLPDYFAQADAGVIPEGWFVMFGSEERPSQSSYGSGSRIFEFASGGDFTKGLYFREGYAEYGSTEGYPLTLEGGNSYLFGFTTAMWKDNGTNTRFEIFDPAGEVVFVQVVDNSPNLKGSTGAVNGASKHSFKFIPETSGNYVIRWTSSGSETGNPDYMEIILANPEVILAK